MNVVLDKPDLTICSTIDSDYIWKTSWVSSKMRPRLRRMTSIMACLTMLNIFYVSLSLEYDQLNWRVASNVSGTVSTTLALLLSFLLAIQDSSISVISALVTTPRSANMMAMSLRVSREDCLMTDSDFMAFFSSFKISVPVAWLFWAFWTSIAPRILLWNAVARVHRLQNNFAVLQSFTTETRSSSCAWRIRGHSARLRASDIILCIRHGLPLSTSNIGRPSDFFNCSSAAMCVFRSRSEYHSSTVIYCTFKPA